MGEASFPIFAFPTMGGIGIDGEARVAITDFHEPAKLLRTHGGGAGMDFVCEINAEAIGMGANLGGFFNETFFAFLDQVEISTSPESPWVARSHFPAV